MIEILKSLAANLVDFFIYLAIAVVVLIGILKCVFPVRQVARRLNRGVRLLETTTGEGRPVWQDVLFLGKELQGSWRRFLVNAEQLDARGLNCNVEDYINDDTVIYSVGHVQLADVIPSLLTSLGILGTFVGLMRGLGGLDMSNAVKTMEGIPQLIGGMTSAFMTSIAGISCSLVFNMLNRMAYGSATRAIDDFNDAFAELVMQKPLEDNVQMICQQEDRSALLRRLSSDMGSRVSEGIVASVEQTLMPVAQSMHSFIMGQTQAQIDGVANIANQFVAQMNMALGNQFTQLGQTLSQVNQAQSISFESMERAMAAADSILAGMTQVQDVTQRVMERFESYIGTIEQARESGSAFLTHGNQVLSGMLTASQEQADLIERLKTAQRDMQTAMRDYTDWSGQVMTAVQEQADGAMKMTVNITRKMDESTQNLSETYAHFVDQLTSGFSRALGMFDESVNGVMTALSGQLQQMQAAALGDAGQAARLQQETEGCMAAISRLQRAVTSVSAALEAAGAPSGEGA